MLPLRLPRLLLPTLLLAAVPVRHRLEAQGAQPAVAHGSGGPAAARLLLARGEHPSLRWPRFSDFAAELRTLYPDSGAVASGYWWLAEGRPTAAARALVQELSRLDTRGLSPAHFDAAWLAEQVALLGARGAADEEQRARFDVGLSIAALRASWALHRGSVRARDVHPEFKLKRPPFDVAAVVARLSRATNVDSALTALEPDYIHYRLTRDALRRYRELAARTATMPLPP
ncbi:MAG: hypothetical protein MUE41_14935, partial [Gemmatimonadaceae bacterium]|nr:hypothetical protein [Gemmatimonadaceae bacterium]